MPEDSEGRKKMRVVVPVSLTGRVMRDYHNSAAAGAHLGVTKTVAKLRESFYSMGWLSGSIELC